jgi:hypothetical protein
MNNITDSELLKIGIWMEGFLNARLLCGQQTHANASFAARLKNREFLPCVSS